MTKKGDVMRQVLRWHVSRLYDDEGLGGELQLPVDFTITPESKCGFDPKYKKNPQKATAITSDSLDWWDADEEHQIEGIADYGEMLKAIYKKNVFEGIQSSSLTSAEKRRLVEGMVFLQFIDDNTTLEKVWEDLKKVQGTPDVSPLIGIESKWLDFTKQARKMSSTLYRQVMGEYENGENPNAGE
jgi:hypothetical protein